jgi:hypothetical protein
MAWKIIAGLFAKAGWTKTEVHAMLGEVRTEITDSMVHSFTGAWFITGGKQRGEMIIVYVIAEEIEQSTLLVPPGFAR